MADKDSSSRRKIINLLKRNGARNAADLAASLGITAMAARQHLYLLVEEGLVEASTRPGGVGRPSKLWSLTAEAEQFFPQGYADLTAGLLSSMREAFGEEGIEKIITIRTREQQQTYRQRMDGAVLLSSRLKRLAEIRTEEGYMAEVQKDDQGYIFIENHCPICAAAKACTGLCAAELSLFRSVLGDDIIVTRCEHILLGARRCAYRIARKDHAELATAAD